VSFLCENNPMMRSLTCCLLALVSGSFVWGQQPENLQRIPRQIQATTGIIQGVALTEGGLGLSGASILLKNRTTGAETHKFATGDGVFLVPDLVPGTYDITITRPGYGKVEINDIDLKAGDVKIVGATAAYDPSSGPEPIRAVVNQGGRIPVVANEGPDSSYRDLARPRELESVGADVRPEEPLAAEEDVFKRVPNRWQLEYPRYRRYPGHEGEIQYMSGRRLDPYNRNKLKGDYPLFGSTFLNLTVTSDTFATGRKIPLPSNLGSSRSDSEEFFGHFGQFAIVENVAISTTLFHGDAAFKPIDWQIKFTPEFNFNYAAVRENGILNIDVRQGPTRYDQHVGLQEAFVEVKMKDLSSEYDFVSARAGIQNFNSDFRGLIFYDQEPGLRIFGNFDNNKYQYNLAAFAMLEKDTNSGLNSFDYRNRNVFIANVYRQDFYKKGYTIQASFHYDKDDATLRYDNNNFLVRPLPVGAVKPHAIRSYYYGLTGDGHVGKINVSHAFYQVLGHDTLNPVSGKAMDINAQMAALELSMDRNWIRYRVSGYWASGENNPRDPKNTTAHGFDSILDSPNFNGGIFSFWNREGLRLLGTLTGLESGDSLNASLRSSKSQGQANFVNPGIFLYNAGADLDLTPKLRLVLNQNFIRFHHTAPLEVLLFQKPIRAGVGSDSGIGIKYRPKLSDNISFTSGFNTFIPFQGFKDISTGRTLYSLFTNVRFQF
jgi:hypothetical protein